MNLIEKRLDAFRCKMQKEGIDACVIPSNDPHFSEYIAPYYRSREYLSGFSGSAGTLVITQLQAALWCDSRYFLQAEEQLHQSSITLQKQGLSTTPSMIEWLKDNLHIGDCIGLDGMLFSVDDFSDYLRSLPDQQIVVTNNLIDDIWIDRPKLLFHPITPISTDISGCSTPQKLQRLRSTLPISENYAYIVTALDDIAWLFNIRGCDIQYNRLAFAYAIIEAQKATVFLDTESLSVQSKEYFTSIGTEVMEYRQFGHYLTTLTVSSIIYNAHTLCYKHYNQLMEHGYKLVRDRLDEGSIQSLKGVKNKTEIEGFRKATIEDGVALVRFFKWLEETLAQGIDTSEITIARMLHHFRSASEHFIDESFASIVGYRSHGAIVHYHATQESNSIVDAGGFLLIDSGAHYTYGTTDITRTLHTGVPSQQEKDDFTHVLMGHIDLATTVFPKGTTGNQLDIIARRELLLHSLNYLHGTGHGVGHSLIVHEGPFSVGQKHNPVILEKGMVLSNEPGLYRTGLWGIRSENMMVVKEHESNDFGDFLSFETLSLCFFDTRCINTALLSPRQIAFVNSYHAMVYNRLSPHLDAQEKTYLALKCKEIGMA